jgi:hypothetical protein
MAAKGPHSWQQSIQQSTNMLCDRSALLKLEKKNTINMTSIARRVDDNNATTIASLMADTIVIRPLWGHTPSNKPYNNQLTWYVTGLRC